MNALILLSEWEASQIEFWKPIEGWPGYDVSSKGRVRSFWERKTRKGRTGLYSEIGPVAHLRELGLNESGYLSVGISKAGSRTKKSCLVNRLVAQAFLPNPENKPETNHKTGVKTDNRLENIEWATRSENIRHADRNGLRAMPSGKRWHDSRTRTFGLDAEKVRAIRRRIAAGEFQKDVAKDFGLRQQAISKIIRGIRWKWVD